MSGAMEHPNEGAAFLHGFSLCILTFASVHLYLIICLVWSLLQVYGLIASSPFSSASVCWVGEWNFHCNHQLLNLQGKHPPTHTLCLLWQILLFHSLLTPLEVCICEAKIGLKWNSPWFPMALLMSIPGPAKLGALWSSSKTNYVLPRILLHFTGGREREMSWPFMTSFKIIPGRLYLEISQGPGMWLAPFPSFSTEAREPLT